MTFHPFSTPNHRIPYVNAVAQCQKCLNTSSYDSVDAYEGRTLKCESCGGELKLYGEVPVGPTSR